ncbi:hypothetical protein J6590_060519 [Homalodisca vitripennis]|nr:hypothetical protein J6590_060519 [Homalodisca vitripennis]
MQRSTYKRSEWAEEEKWLALRILAYLEKLTSCNDGEDCEGKNLPHHSNCARTLNCLPRSVLGSGKQFCGKIRFVPKATNWYKFNSSPKTEHNWLRQATESTRCSETTTLPPPLQPRRARSALSPRLCFYRPD